MDSSPSYAPLNPQSLQQRLSHIEPIAQRVGSDEQAWKVKEVGDGNLNLVFIVSGSIGTVIVKQALPYVRLVGDSWPLPLYRAFFEYHALTRQEERDPGSVPEVFYFDEEQAIIVMEFLSPHTILRNKLIAGEPVRGVAETLGVFCARTAFRGSDLSLSAAKRKADAALFLGNVALCEITEDLVFTDPYYDAKMNHHNELLDNLVTELRSDIALKTQVQHMMVRFSSSAQTLCHGDLHTGSVMCTDSETRVIDPEFAFYGPMGFDLGMLLANFLMAFFSQKAHTTSDSVEQFESWILDTVDAIVQHFNAEFTSLWNSERTGILYPKALFEDQQHASVDALNEVLRSIWEDALGFAGIEMHRRTLSLAHNADFESIEDKHVRAPLEARNIVAGKRLIMERQSITDTAALVQLIKQTQAESYL